MNTTYRIPHFVATTLGVAAIGWQASALIERSGTLTPVQIAGIILGTVMAGVLPTIAEAAWHSTERAKSLLFIPAVLFLVGYVLPSNISSTTEIQEARINSAAATHADIAQLRNDHAQASKLVTEAQAWVASECKSGTGPRCRGVTFTLQQRQAFKEKLAGQIAAAEAHKPATPILPVWHPALLPIGLELAIWTTLFYGLGPLARRSAITEREEPLTVDEIDEVRRVLRITKADVDELRSQGKRQHEIAAHFGVNQGRISELMSGKRAEVYVH